MTVLDRTPRLGRVHAGHSIDWQAECNGHEAGGAACRWAANPARKGTTIARARRHLAEYPSHQVVMSGVTWQTVGG
jgi:hypothetical protein